MPSKRLRRVRGPLLLAAIIVALVAAGAALATNPSKEKVARTAAGNREAKAAVLRRADLGVGWSGGFRKPQLSSTPPCKGYRPKQSDLTLVGAAETDWHKSFFTIDSTAQVLQTAAMVQRDWQRTAVAPQVVPCLRRSFAKGLGSTATLISFGKVAFPHVAPDTLAFRLVAKVKTPNGPFPLEIDFVLFGGGHNELSLELSGPKAEEDSLVRTEQQLTRLMARRAHS